VGKQVVQLLYTNSGAGILALGSNGIQRLWKWVPNEQNPSGKVIVKKSLRELNACCLRF